jgi:flavodoxin
MPMVARTFLDKADLSGKKIAHFCTHEGSGFGGSESDLKSRQPRAIYLPSLAIAGTQVDNSTKAIQDWAKKVIKEGESK